MRLEGLECCTHLLEIGYAILCPSISIPFDMLTTAFMILGCCGTFGILSVHLGEAFGLDTNFFLPHILGVLTNKYRVSFVGLSIICQANSVAIHTFEFLQMRIM
jgi:hypothetical protein